MPTYTIEMLWRCHVCKHGSNEGLKRHCANCGHPKSEKDEEFFPPDTSEAAALSGEAARRAAAGPDWKCKYCESLQGGLNKCCTECGVDPVTGSKPWEAMVQTLTVDGDHLGWGPQLVGIQAATGGTMTVEHVPMRTVAARLGGPNSPEFRRVAAHASKSDTPPAPDAPQVRDGGGYRDDGGYRDNVRVDALVSVVREPWRAPPRTVGAIFATSAVALVVWLVFHTRIVDAHVTDVRWEHRVLIDRYQVYHRDGFDPEPSAFHVESTGPRIHHYEHVRIGSHDEHYTVSVACGQDCRPQSCYTTSRNCTSNRNGTATCTGGDRICPPDICSARYCDEPRSRTVDDYEDQPRYRTYYAWDAWDWGYNRTVRHAGATFETTWPTEAECTVPLGQGERERSKRKEEYHVTFADKKKTYDYTPSTEDEFQRYPIGSQRRLKVGIAHGVEVLPRGQ